MTTIHPDLTPTRQPGETAARHDETDTRSNRRRKIIAALKAIAILAL